jgi:hypothetical protein
VGRRPAAQQRGAAGVAGAARRGAAGARERARLPKRVGVACFDRDLLQKLELKCTEQ